MPKTEIGPETTIAELGAELDALGVAELRLSIDKGDFAGFRVSAVLHALESPRGRANTTIFRRADLAGALRDLVDGIRTMRSRRIEVIAPDGTLLGLYRRNAEGKRYAKKHADAYVGATIR